MSEEKSIETAARRLHSAAIHLLRGLRAEDRASGLTGPRLSALSVLVFGGEKTIGELAAAEQVRAPTMSRLIKDMEYAGLVSRSVDAADKRINRIAATAKGRQLMLAGQKRRIERLATAIAGLTGAERKDLRAAIDVIERLAEGVRR